MEFRDSPAPGLGTAFVQMSALLNFAIDKEKIVTNPCYTGFTYDLAGRGWRPII